MRTDLQKELTAMRSEMQKEFRQVDFRLEQMKSEMADEFEKVRSLINEVGGRVIEVKTRVESYIEMALSQSKRVDNLIESSEWK